MRDLDRTQLVHPYEFEAAGETVLGEILGQKAGHVGGAAETQELEFASRLLGVSSEQELEQFLGDVLASAVKGARSLVGTPTGQALTAILTDAAKQALPIAGGAIGNYLAPGSGQAWGDRAGHAAADLLGLEMEGLSGEDREFEFARHFIRFGRGAWRNLASPRWRYGRFGYRYPNRQGYWGRQYRDGQLWWAAHHAAAYSARRYLPGLLPLLGRPYRPRGGWFYHHGRMFPRQALSPSAAYAADPGFAYGPPEPVAPPQVIVAPAPVSPDVPAPPVLVPGVIPPPAPPDAIAPPDGGAPPPDDAAAQAGAGAPADPSAQSPPGAPPDSGAGASPSAEFAEFGPALEFGPRGRRYHHGRYRRHRRGRWGRGGWGRPRWGYGGQWGNNGGMSDDQYDQDPDEGSDEMYMQEYEQESELEGVLGQITAASRGATSAPSSHVAAPVPLPPEQVNALAHQMLHTQSEAELEQFLGDLLSGAAKAVGGLFKGPVGGALGGALKGVAKAALPAIGTAIMPGIGTALGTAASSLFEYEGELESIPPQERELETAERFIDFAVGAAQHAARPHHHHHGPESTQAIVDDALRASAQQFAPGLLRPSTSPVQPGPEHNGHGFGGAWYGDDEGDQVDFGRPEHRYGMGEQGRTGRWIRRGRRIVLYGA